VNVQRAMKGIARQAFHCLSWDDMHFGERAIVTSTELAKSYNVGSEPNAIHVIHVAEENPTT
jgi:hypothetical protein